MSDICKKCGFDYGKWERDITPDCSRSHSQIVIEAVRDNKSDLRKFGYDPEKPLHLGGFCQKCVPQAMQRKQKLAQIIALMTELLEELE